MIKDLGGLMKQAQQLQSKMSDMQAELERLDIEGASGGGLVKVRINGKGAMLAVDIDPSLLKPEDAEIIEDLIVAAHTEARSKMERATADKMKEVTGGLPLPPGFNLGV